MAPVRWRWPFKRCFDGARALLIWDPGGSWWPLVTSTAVRFCSALSSGIKIGWGLNYCLHWLRHRCEAPVRARITGFSPPHLPQFIFNESFYWWGGITREDTQDKSLVSLDFWGYIMAIFFYLPTLTMMPFKSFFKICFVVVCLGKDTVFDSSVTSGICH